MLNLQSAVYWVETNTKHWLEQSNPHEASCYQWSPVLAVLVYKWQARDDIYGENDDRKMERCRKNSESVVLAADSVTE